MRQDEARNPSLGSAAAARPKLGALAVGKLPARKAYPVRRVVHRARERSLDAALATACVYLSRAFFAKLRSMPARSTAATEDTVQKQLLLTIGRAGGGRSSRAIAIGELEPAAPPWSDL